LVTNAEGCVLTLDALAIKDAKESNPRFVKFSYVEHEAECEGYAAAHTHNARGPKAYAYRVEERDLWGFYSRRGSGGNDFNISGLQSRSMECDAWSLATLALPSGMTIEWEYEPNRYDKVNNVAVASTGTEPRYGGGPRVKRMRVASGVDGQWEQYSYVYLDLGASEGSLTGAQTSGHATVEPFPYYALSDGAEDPRQLRTRGGLYTPAKVMYEQVTVVREFDENTGEAPYGYTVYEYATPRDQGCTNGGAYGENDNSWRHGFLKSISKYNSSGKLVARDEWEAEFTEETNLVRGVNRGSDGSIGRGHELIRGGVYRQKSLEEYRDGVWRKREFTYADEMPALAVATKEGAKDRVQYHASTIAGILRAPNPEHEYKNICLNDDDQVVPCSQGAVVYRTRNMGEMERGRSCGTKSFGNPQKLDVVVASEAELSWTCEEGARRCYEGCERTDVLHEIRVSIAKDVAFECQTPPSGTWYPSVAVLSQERPLTKGYDHTDWGFPWDESSHSYLWNPPGLREGFELVGVGVWNIDNDPQGLPDIVVAYWFPESQTMDRIRQYYRILYNVELNGQEISYRSTLTRSFHPGTGAFSACTYGDIDGNNKLDVVYTNPRAPEGIGPVLVGLNFDPSGNISDVYQTDGGQDGIWAPSPYLQLVDWDGDGGANDLLMTSLESMSITGYQNPELKKQVRRYVYANARIENGTVMLGPQDPSSLARIHQPYGDGIAVFNESTPQDAYFLGAVNDEKAQEHYVLCNARKAVIALHKPEVTRDYNGSANRVVESAAGGLKVCEERIPAFCHDGYATMGTQKHMLKQKYKTVRYDVDPASGEEKAVGADVKTWETYPGAGGTWYSAAQHAWRCSMLPSGVATSPIPAFSASSSDWPLQEGVTMRNRYGSPTETKRPNGESGVTYATTLYGKNGLQPIAEVYGARHGECLFTSFEQQPAGLFTERVGPGAQAAIVGEQHHAGNKCLSLSKKSADDPYYLTDDTPLNTELDADGEKKIRWEFWAKKAEGVQATTGFTCLQTCDDASSWHGGTYFELSTQWRKYDFEVTVPRGKLKQRFHVVLRPPRRESDGQYLGGTIYYDDVRAYPADALMTSTVYHPIHQKPTGVCDANNNCREIRYDGFGRVKAEFNCAGKKVKEYEYRSMGANFSPYVPTGFAATVAAPSVTLKWEGGDPDGDAVKYTIKVLRVEAVQVCPEEAPFCFLWSTFHLAYTATFNEAGNGAGLEEVEHHIAQFPHDEDAWAYMWYVSASDGNITVIGPPKGTPVDDMVAYGAVFYWQ